MKAFILTVAVVMSCAIMSFVRHQHYKRKLVTISITNNSPPITVTNFTLSDPIADLIRELKGDMRELAYAEFEVGAILGHAMGTRGATTNDIAMLVRARRSNDMTEVDRWIKGR